jgi:nitrogen fixation/metabolism regulation signal transduction histidine kinase
MSRLEPRQTLRLVVAGIFLTLLLAAVFTFGSLGVPFEPKNWRDAVTLYAVSTLITAALLVFSLVLTRTMLRLWAERSKDHLGARFKFKMVVGAMAISLLPILFMFFVSYSLLNRTLGRWFPRPLEIASEQTQLLLNDLGHSQVPRLHSLAHQAIPYVSASTDEFLQHALASGADAAWILNADGKAIRGGVVCDEPPEDRAIPICAQPNVLGAQVRVLQSGVELWEAAGKTYLAARVPLAAANPQSGALVTAYRTSPAFYARIAEIQSQTREYYSQKQNLRALKRQMLLLLLFFTLLLLFSVTWVALFLAKQVTVPIQALAEGTREVSSGNFEYQVPEQSQDELGLLVRSFNSMTGQLRDSRSQIDQFTRNLQQAVQELERRRQLMEAVLENIPASVLSLDSSGAIQRANSAVARMFGPAAKDVTSLETLLGPDASRIVGQLLRRSLRMGVVSREIESVVAGRVLHLAVTVALSVRAGPIPVSSWSLTTSPKSCARRNSPPGKKSPAASRTKSKILSPPSSSPRNASRAFSSAAAKIPPRRLPAIPNSLVSSRNVPASSNKKSPPSPIWSTNFPNSCASRAPSSFPRTPTHSSTKLSAFSPAASTAWS